MNIAQHIENHIKKTPRGKPFTGGILMQYGTRASVDQTLSRLTKTGKIIRLIRGVYVRPEISRHVGKVLPEPLVVVKVIANKTNEVIQVSEAEAARQLGLSTQVPSQPIFLTSGLSRQFSLGNLHVTLKHVSKRKIPLPGTKVGLAILALWYLGKNLTTIEIIEKIKNKLSEKEFKRFLSSKEYMPGWMSNIVFQYEKNQRK